MCVSRVSFSLRQISAVVMGCKCFFLPFPLIYPASWHYLIKMLWTPSLPHAKHKQKGHQENAPPHHCPSTAITTGWSPKGDLLH